MAGEEKLKKLLKNMSPTLDDQEYVFTTTQNLLEEMIKLNPVGLTAIVASKLNDLTGDGREL